MIHINLNMIIYTHVEHSPTKTIYVKYYAEKMNAHTEDVNERPGLCLEVPSVPANVAFIQDCLLQQLPNPLCSQ